MNDNQPEMVIERQERKCFLCGSNADSFFDNPAHVDVYFSCKICGTFRINDRLRPDCTDEQKAILSAYCRRNPGSWVYIEPDEGIREKLCMLVPHYSPPEQLDRLLQVLGDKSQKLGKPANFNVMKDYPLIVAIGWQEAQFLIGALIQKKYVDTNAVLLGPQYIVTMEGWNRIEELKTSGRSLTQCFVAMAFRKDTDAIWEKVIEPAINEAGYKPFRIDREHHVNRIDDEIIAQIRRSRFMVADFTYQRGGVYFESGMMHGLGRKVIWMCHEDDIAASKSKLKEGLHFDVRQFNFLKYCEPNEDIKKQLFNRILAIEGEGPLLTAEAEG